MIFLQARAVLLSEGVNSILPATDAIDWVNHNAKHKGNASSQARLILLLLPKQWRAASPPSADARSGAERNKLESKTSVVSILRNFISSGRPSARYARSGKHFCNLFFYIYQSALGNTGNAGKVKIGQAYALLCPFIACIQYVQQCTSYGEVMYLERSSAA